MAETPTQTKYVELLKRVDARVAEVIVQNLKGEDVDRAFDSQSAIPGAAAFTPAQLVDRSEREGSKAEFEETASKRLNPRGERFSAALKRIEQDKVIYTEAELSLESARSFLGELHHELVLGDANLEYIRHDLMTGADDLAEGVSQNGSFLLLEALDALNKADAQTSRLTRGRDKKVAGPALLDAIEDAGRLLASVDEGLERARSDERRMEMAEFHSREEHFARIEAQRSHDLADVVREVWVEEMQKDGFRLPDAQNEAAIDMAIDHVAEIASSALGGQEQANTKTIGYSVSD